MVQLSRRAFAGGIGSASVLPLRHARAATPGGTLTVAIFADPLGFDPHLAGNLQGRAACRAVHDTLFTLDSAGRLAPGLAESWTAPDDRTFVLTLRQGIKFHDGTPFDAEAVVYNIRRIFDPAIAAIGGIRAGEISALDKAETAGAHTVRLVLKYPFAAFLFPFTDVAGCIGSPAAMERLKQDYAFAPIGDRAVHPQGIPEGLAFGIRPQSRVLAARQAGRRPAHPPPHSHRQHAARRASGRRGADRRGAAAAGHPPAAPGQPDRRVRARGLPLGYFGFNLRAGMPGQPEKLRQAFQYAIDREALHQVAYYGTGAIGYDGILPGNPFFDANYKPYAYDVGKAKRLIDEAKLTGPVTFTAPLQPDPVKQRAAQVFQANARRSGSRGSSCRQIDSAGYRNALTAGTLQLDLQGWWGYRPDPDQYLAILLGSSGSYAKSNGYANPEMDRLILAERSAASEADRRPLFRRMSELMNQDAAYVPWHYTSDFKGLSPKVRGFLHAPDGIIAFQDISLA